jgi:hypothetical protein
MTIPKEDVMAEGEYRSSGQYCKTSYPASIAKPAIPWAFD